VANRATGSVVTRFATYVATLGRGPGRSRALTRVEAADAMRMLLAGEADPIQIGAFLMLLRMKEETGAEIAGFIRAARARLPAPGEPRPDLDWPCYAGKARRPPWHLLAALRLAGAGYRVALHGLDGQIAPSKFKPDQANSNNTAWIEIVRPLEWP